MSLKLFYPIRMAELLLHYHRDIHQWKKSDFSSEHPVISLPRAEFFTHYIFFQPEDVWLVDWKENSNIKSSCCGYPDFLEDNTRFFWNAGWWAEKGFNNSMKTFLAWIKSTDGMVLLNDLPERSLNIVRNLSFFEILPSQTLYQLVFRPYLPDNLKLNNNFFQWIDEQILSLAFLPKNQGVFHAQPVELKQPDHAKVDEFLKSFSGNLTLWSTQKILMPEKYPWILTTSNKQNKNYAFTLCKSRYFRKTYIWKNNNTVSGLMTLMVSGQYLKIPYMFASDDEIYRDMKNFLKQFIISLKIPVLLTTREDLAQSLQGITFKLRKHKIHRAASKKLSSKIKNLMWQDGEGDWSYT